MKVSSDELFRLIKSLSAQEKKFFKEFNAKGDDTKKGLSYLKLFDIINELNEYDEEKLLLKLKRAGFIHNLKFAKSYLSEVIYKSLTYFHSALDIEIELQEIIHRIKILIKKDLLDIADKLLFKAKQQALDNEKYDYLLVLSHIEYFLIGRLLNVEKSEKYLKTEIEKQKKYIACLQNFFEFQFLSLSARIIVYKMINPSTKNKVDEMDRLMQHPLLSSPKNASSFVALRQYYFIHFLHGSAFNKIDKKTLHRQKEWIEYLEKNKTKPDNYIRTYLNAMSHMILIQVNLYNLREAEYYCNKAVLFVQSLPAKLKTKDVSAKMADVTINYMSGIINDNAAKAIEAWENYRNTNFRISLNQFVITTINGNLLSAHLLLKQYNEALKYANKIIGSKTNGRLNVQLFTRFFTLIIHYELGNYAQLPYMAKATERYLLKHNGIISKYDKLVLYYFERILPEINNKQKETEWFKMLKKELLQLPDKSILSSKFDIDITDWIESKIQRRQLTEILKEKTLANKVR